MDLRDLRYFETIASLQHVGKAAAVLHRTQPALTSCVRRLEEECGAALVERTGRGIRLTRAGEVLLRWAQRIRFDEVDARREMSDIGKGLSGHIRIGIVPTAAEYLLPAAARQLLKEAPELTLRTVVGLVDTLMPLLRQGEIDLLVGSESPAEAGYVSTVLAEDMIVVAANADHELLQGKPRLSDLVGYRWALQPPGAPTRDWLDHAFERQQLPRPKVQVETTMLLMLPSLIAQTGLLSFVSRHHIAQHGASTGLREIPIREATMRRRLVVTYRKHSYQSPAVGRLLGLLARTRPPTPELAPRRTATAPGSSAGRRPRKA